MALSPQMFQLANQLITQELLKWQQANRQISTPNDVRSFVQFLIQNWPILMNSASDVESIVAQQFNIQINIITTPGHLPWFANYKTNNTMTYWNAYMAYIQAKGQNAAKIDVETDAIMDCLPQPSTQSFSYRGIVIGYVQSGKTSNFVGLINKAADTGYKLIIVFSGMYNDLRRQTNERIDEGFIGRYTGIDPSRTVLWNNNSIINVSQFRTGVSVNNLTSSELNGDVNGNLTNVNPYNPQALTIAVCKKNTHTLDALLRMLDTGQRDNNGHPCNSDVPLLVIDDEADSAGIDTNFDEQLTPADLTIATAINKKIRCLLSMFKKSAYVGYTATPYANFLIDKTVTTGQKYDLTYARNKTVSFVIGDGLFPKDFAVCLESNDDYIGPEAIFGDDPLPIVRHYDEAIVSAIFKPKNGKIAALPRELEEAILSFIVATAIRRLRGQAEKHSSMLVHVDYRIQNMNDVAQLVADFVSKIRQAYNVGVGYNSYDAMMMNLFVNDFQRTVNLFSADHQNSYGVPSANYQWHNIQTEIYHVLNKIDVKCVNSDDSSPFSGNLDYKSYENNASPAQNGYYVIAVGGNCFSRGLTLEGLTTSFFYRNSKAYDTLMQMGRWFGYRPDYYDLCRIYISQTIQNRFAGMTIADIHLRETVKKIMAMPNVTPEDFVIAIEIAAGMKVTSPNKTGAGIETRPALLEGLKQTTCMPIKTSDRQSMYSAVDALFKNIGTPLPTSQRLQINKNHIWWTHVSSQPVIGFIQQFNNILSSAGCLQPNLIGLDQFINSEIANGHLTDWTVVLINNITARYGQFNLPSASQVPINLTLRTKNDLSTNPDVFSRSKGITQGSDESLDYTDAELPNMMVNGNVSDELCRIIRPNHRGLLLIYPIIIAQNNPIISQQFQQYPLFGYAVSSPSGILTKVGRIILN